MYRILWVKCTTSTGCKSIRIAATAVMDSWDGRCLALMSFVLSKVLKKEMRKWDSEYSSGTTVKIEDVLEERQIGLTHPSGFLS
jgi:hypothetical protein